MPRTAAARPAVDGGADALAAFHAAACREVGEQLGAGTVLAFGVEPLGLARLGAPDRRLIRVVSDRAAGSGAPPDAVMRPGHLSVRARSVEAVVSVATIDASRAPERHAAELARVCHATGTAYVVTPSRTADLARPLPVYPFDGHELASLLHLFFRDVRVHGLEGSPELLEALAAHRARDEQLGRFDRLDLRHKVPPARRMLARRSTAGAAVDPSDYFLTDAVTPTTPGLLAVARAPRV
jgi:hypothetical protein